MLHQIIVVRTAKLSQDSEKVVKISDNVEFTLYRDTNAHSIRKTKGEFEIKKITETYDDGVTNVLKLDKFKFVTSNRSAGRTLTFYIAINVEMKEVTALEEFCDVKYQLQISSTRLQWLEIFEFFKDEFVLPGYDSLKFTYYIKKVNESTENDIGIHIENPYDVKIQGKKGDFKSECCSTKNVDLRLSFGFPADAYRKSVSEAVEKSEAPPNDICEQKHASGIDESRPASAIPSPSNATTILQKLHLNKRFSDVYLVTSDQTKIASHRCILAEYSDIFAKIFEETSDTEIPVQIVVDGFTAATVQSALNFLYDIPKAINGKEVDVFHFAVKYSIQHLIKACCSFFEESVSPSNVCEFIQIAYSNNFEELKQKCLKILVEKKDETDAAELADLPKNIVVEAFCFKS